MNDNANTLPNKEEVFEALRPIVDPELNLSIVDLGLIYDSEPDEDNKTFAELKLKEALVLVPFVGVIVFTGVYPKPVLERIEPAVDALIVHVENKTDFESPQPATIMIEEDETHEEEGE